MIKKRYRSPMLMTLETEEIENVVGASTGISGYDDIYTFAEELGLSPNDFDDFQLAEMDTDGDYFITEEEYNTWADNQ